MKCPCCNLTLKSMPGQLVGCGTNHSHKFLVELDYKTLRRVFVLQNDPPEKCNCKKGERFPVMNDESFE